MVTCGRNLLEDVDFEAGEEFGKLAALQQECWVAGARGKLGLRRAEGLVEQPSARLQQCLDVGAKRPVEEAEDQGDGARARAQGDAMRCLEVAAQALDRQTASGCGFADD